MKVECGRYTEQVSFGIILMLPGHGGDNHWDIIIDFGTRYLEFTFGEDG
jgi:hypothetical protein